MKNKISEILVPVLLIILLVLFLNPFGFWMPTALVMTMLCFLVIIFLIFGVFLWKEKAGDEREQVHKMLSGRVAFLVGAGVLVLGIVVQEYRHNLDPWLIYALTAMILAKIGTLWYSRRYF